MFLKLEVLFKWTDYSSCFKYPFNPVRDSSLSIILFIMKFLRGYFLLSDSQSLTLCQFPFIPPPFLFNKVSFSLIAKDQNVFHTLHFLLLMG